MKSLLHKSNPLCTLTYTARTLGTINIHSFNNSSFPLQFFSSSSSSSPSSSLSSSSSSSSSSINSSVPYQLKQTTIPPPLPRPISSPYFNDNNISNNDNDSRVTIFGYLGYISIALISLLTGASIVHNYYKPDLTIPTLNNNPTSSSSSSSSSSSLSPNPILSSEHQQIIKE